MNVFYIVDSREKEENLAIVARGDSILSVEKNFVKTFGKHPREFGWAHYKLVLNTKSLYRPPDMPIGVMPDLPNVRSVDEQGYDL